MALVVVDVTSLDQFERLCNLPGSLSGEFNPLKRRGEVIFGSTRSGLAARQLITLFPLSQEDRS